MLYYQRKMCVILWFKMIKILKFRPFQVNILEEIIICVKKFAESIFFTRYFLHLKFV